MTFDPNHVGTGNAETDRLIQEAVQLVLRAPVSDHLEVVNALLGTAVATLKFWLQSNGSERAGGVVVSKMEAARRLVSGEFALLKKSEQLALFRAELTLVMSRREYAGDTAACSEALVVVGALMRNWILLNPELGPALISEIDAMRFSVAEAAAESADPQAPIVLH